jgi:hypothetical protein
VRDEESGPYKGVLNAITILILVFIGYVMLMAWSF